MYCLSESSPPYCTHQAIIKKDRQSLNHSYTINQSLGWLVWNIAELLYSVIPVIVPTAGLLAGLQIGPGHHHDQTHRRTGHQLHLPVSGGHVVVLPLCDEQIVGSCQYNCVLIVGMMIFLLCFFFLVMTLKFGRFGGSCCFHLWGKWRQVSPKCW
jgi:hypothetical protein